MAQWARVHKQNGSALSVESFCLTTPLTRVTRCSVQYLCIANTVESNSTITLTITLIVWITSSLNILCLENYFETLLDVHWGSSSNETSDLICYIFQSSKHTFLNCLLNCLCQYPASSLNTTCMLFVFWIRCSIISLLFLFTQYSALFCIKKKKIIYGFFTNCSLLITILDYGTIEFWEW